LTLRDGAVRVIRGYAVMQGAEGMRLRQGDIIETAQPGMVQLEFSGGTIVAVGPSSRLFLFSPGGATAEFVLLSGWVKGETPAGRTYRFVSPWLAATSRGGAILLHVTSEAAEVFVESGSASVGVASAGAAASSKTKSFFARRAGKPVTTASRPDAAFLSGMPVPFRDTLPPRLSRFAGKKAPEPKRDHDVSYAEVERWLTLSPAWRRGFVERFRPRLEDDAFHRAIEAHLAALPDWEPILHPEKHKTAPTPPDKSDSPPGRYLR
jgi:hypothetical protein